MSRIAFKKFATKNLVHSFNSPELISTSLSFFNKDPSKLVLGASALNIVTRKSPSILYNKLSKKRNSRDESLGCQVLLNKTDSKVFFNYLNFVILPNLRDFNGFCFEKVFKYPTNSLIIKIEDLLVFPELNKDLDLFYGLGGVTVVFNFHTTKNIKSFLALQNFPFNDSARN